MSGFISEMRRSGNGLLVGVSVIAAIGGQPFGYDTEIQDDLTDAEAVDEDSTSDNETAGDGLDSRLAKETT